MSFPDMKWPFGSSNHPSLGSFTFKMSALYKNAPLFEAEITSNIDSRVFRAGYLPDLKLSPHDHTLYPVYPDFIEKSGESIPQGASLSLPCCAQMHPLSEEVRQLLRPQIAVGQEIDMYEGAVHVMTARILRIFD